VAWAESNAKRTLDVGKHGAGERAERASLGQAGARGATKRDGANAAWTESNVKRSLGVGKNESWEMARGELRITQITVSQNRTTTVLAICGTGLAVSSSLIGRGCCPYRAMHTAAILGGAWYLMSVLLT